MLLKYSNEIIFLITISSSIFQFISLTFEFFKLKMVLYDTLCILIIFGFKNIVFWQFWFCIPTLEIFWVQIILSDTFDFVKLGILFQLRSEDVWYFWFCVQYLRFFWREIKFSDTTDLWIPIVVFLASEMYCTFDC